MFNATELRLLETLIQARQKQIAKADPRKVAALVRRAMLDAAELAAGMVREYSPKAGQAGDE